MSWYDALREIASLGSQAPRPGSLAGLHAARQESLAQFFTPNDLARFAWNIVEPAIERALVERGAGGKVSLLDNAVGSGRLLQFATPEKHLIGGVDVHGETISALVKAAETAGFECDFLSCGMEAIKPRHFNVAIINPPFSIRLESPLLFPYPCTTWGKFGPNTSAMSHAYAVHQALDAAELVVAILPSTFAQEVAADLDISPRLRAVFELPRGTFREEGTEVQTALLVFDSKIRGGAPETHRLASLDVFPPDLGLSCEATAYRARIGGLWLDDECPSITMPVTGKKRVIVAHDGRKVVLKFGCGLTQAKVLNAIMGDRIEAYQEAARISGKRHPKGLRYTGQGRLDIEAHLAQPDPIHSFREFIGELRAAGGAPDVGRGVWDYLRRRVRQHERASTHFRHNVFVRASHSTGDGMTGIARKTHTADPKVWGAPVIKAGEEVEFARIDGGLFGYTAGGQPFSISVDDIYKRFECRPEGEAKDAWVTVREGLHVAFPSISQSLFARAKSLGLDQWLWKYQINDLVEMLIKPRRSSAIIAWQMGLGKARLASAAILLNGCKHGMITVDAGLVPEMVRELRGLPIPAETWQVIDSPEKLASLRTINVISYNLLRAAVDTARPLHTYARRLRRRIGLLMADEGHLLANPHSLQSRALWNLSARRRFVLSGSPIPNYPRNLHPILNFVAGDSTASQRYGYHRAYLEENHRFSMAYSVRGIDRFADDFVTLEWVTNEFKEDLTTGAKREVPKIANLTLYREIIATHVKRRLAQEPDVAEFIKIPVPTERVVEVEWDDEHLAYYLKVADEFATWYKKARGSSRNANLIAILARIQAVAFAGNYPQHGVEGIGAYYPLTSKNRYALDRLEELAAEGHKTILYAHSPALLDRFGRELDKRGIESVIYHGGKSIKTRTLEIDQRFREGDCPILLASLGVTQKGLNLYQADRAIFHDRDWLHTVEDQALHRLLRPQQAREVEAEYLHLPGGIDAYQAQMVAFKKESSSSGLDWATPELDDVEFLHLETILGKFCHDLAKLRGVEARDLREVLAA